MKFFENLRPRTRKFFRFCFAGDGPVTRRSRLIAYWQGLANKHAGQPCFVIGNGPSLKVSDLSRLKGFTTIASNKIFLAFEETDWRPSYYTIGDPILWEKISSEICGRFDFVHSPDYLTKKGNLDNFVTWRSLWPNELDVKEPSKFSANGAWGFFGGHTITFENLQFAAHLGCNPIYIIGCDHYYAGEKGVALDQVVAAGAACNHFHKDYRAEGEVVNSAPIERMNQAYRAARLFSDRSGVKIYNATRGGELEAFERVDLDEVLAGC